MLEKKEYILSALEKIRDTRERIINNSEEISSHNYYYNSSSGMERLESTCMLLIAMGESIKGVDKITNKELFKHYPDVDWKGAMGIRDIITHHYFDLDGEIVFNVVKNELSNMLKTINRIIDNIEIL